VAYSPELKKEDLADHVAKDLLASHGSVKLYVEVHLRFDGSSQTVFVIYQDKKAGAPFAFYLEAIEQYNTIIKEKR
jgi:hypothetical protein